MKIFCTGASGYIGGSVAKYLVATGHQVTGLVRSQDKAGGLSMSHDFTFTTDSGTPTPTPDPGATPTPTPTPTATPTGGTTVPASIDASCGSSVSTALNAWIAKQPDGSTLVFPPGSCYKLGGDNAINLANRSGLTLVGTGSSLQLRSGEYDGPHLAMQVGGRLDPVADSGDRRPTARLDDSAVVVDAFGIQAQAWAHRSWWGPGWQSALPLSNNSPPLDGIGFQRAAVVPSDSPWLSWLGPWTTDFFVARTEGEPAGPGSDPLVTSSKSCQPINTAGATKISGHATRHVRLCHQR